MKDPAKIEIASDAFKRFGQEIFGATPKKGKEQKKNAYMSQQAISSQLIEWVLSKV